MKTENSNTETNVDNNHAETTHESVLKTAAVAIGEFAGSVTHMAESILPHKAAAPDAKASDAKKTAAKPAKTTPMAARTAAKKGAAATAKGRLEAKHKNRVPRKQKKVMARKASAASGDSGAHPGRKSVVM